MRVSCEPVSLDMPIGEEDDGHLGDFIEDDSVVSPEKAVTFSMLQIELNKILDTLSWREKEVTVFRLGLQNNIPKTLEEVGREFNVTRERIRQIEAKALRRIRYRARKHRLFDFVNE